MSWCRRFCFKRSPSYLGHCASELRERQWDVYTFFRQTIGTQCKHGPRWQQQINAVRFLKFHILHKPIIRCVFIYTTMFYVFTYYSPNSFLLNVKRFTTLKISRESYGIYKHQILPPDLNDKPILEHCTDARYQGRDRVVLAFTNVLKNATPISVI